MSKKNKNPKRNHLYTHQCRQDARWYECFSRSGRAHVKGIKLNPLRLGENRKRRVSGRRYYGRNPHANGWTDSHRLPSPKGASQQRSAHWPRRRAEACNPSCHDSGYQLPVPLTPWPPLCDLAKMARRKMHDVILQVQSPGNLQVLTRTALFDAMSSTDMPPPTLLHH